MFTHLSKLFLPCSQILADDLAYDCSPYYLALLHALVKTNWST